MRPYRITWSRKSGKVIIIKRNRTFPSSSFFLVSTNIPYTKEMAGVKNLIPLLKHEIYSKYQEGKFPSCNGKLVSLQLLLNYNRHLLQAAWLMLKEDAQRSEKELHFTILQSPFFFFFLFGKLQHEWYNSDTSLMENLCIWLLSQRQRFKLICLPTAALISFKE